MSKREKELEINSTYAIVNNLRLMYRNEHEQSKVIMVVSVGPYSKLFTISISECHRV
jgi:hypothetical protein